MIGLMFPTALYENAKLNVGYHFTLLHIISVMSVIIYLSIYVTKPVHSFSKAKCKDISIMSRPRKQKSTIMTTFTHLLHLSWKSQKVPALQWATLEPLQFPFRSSSATPSSNSQPHLTCTYRLWSRPRHPTVSLF